MKSFHHVIPFACGIAATVALAGAVVSPSHGLAEVSKSLSSGNLTDGTAFDHTIPFTFSVAGGIDYFTARISFPAALSITPFFGGLFSGATLIALGAGSTPPPGLSDTNSFLVGSLAPGAYSLRAISLASGSSSLNSYGGLLWVTEPIDPPESEIWALILLGAGLVALRLRRKSRLDALRHFA